MNLSGKTLAITGAGGFIGARMAARARAMGIRVKGLELSPSAASRAGGGDVRVGDVGDARVARDLCEGADYVLHTAARVGEGGDVEEFRATNVEATRVLAEAARRTGVQCFIHVSSVMVYGFSYPPFVREDGPLRGEGDAYCQTKIESEAALRPFRSSLRVVVIRPGDVYGPGSTHWVVRPLRMMQKGRFAVPAGGRGVMNHVYVDNLLDAVFLAMERDVDGAFNVTDGAATTFLTYFELLAAAAGGGKVLSLPGPLMRTVLRAMHARARRQGREPDGVPATVDYMSRPHPYSIERARVELGYQPQVLLEEGLERVGEWLRREGMARRW